MGPPPMSKGIEMLVRSLLSATGINVEAVKAEAVERIQNFETNVATLNSRLEAIEVNQRALCVHHGVEYTPPKPVPVPQPIAAE